ncbi:MAG TPA: hypothetical protein VH278_14525 [Burkholderiaceae bacterium]|nr:hypothetical protein [Burkholderiaceae bacterium]
MRQRDRVHRTGAGTADRFEVEVRFFEQPVEHAPGKRAQGSAALQRQVDDALTHERPES